MNGLLDLLRARRSIPPRLLGAPGPDEAELETLLTVASRVPDHGKLVAWRFLVIEGEARMRIGEAIAATFQADEPGADKARVEVERKRLSQAPLVVGVVSCARPHAKIPEWEQVMSAGAVCMNLILAANAMGFGTCWLTEWFAFDRRILDRLGLGPTETMAGFIHIGRPLEQRPDRDRPKLSDIVTRI
ncbi:MAG: nitroreductase [Enterovirga sp.]|nr:nitroreductase [Enterovirga sp.]